MKFPYRSYVIVGDADVEAARYLVASELGPIEGAGWFGVALKDIHDASHWASSSVLTDANVNTIVWFQGTPNALNSLKYVFIDAQTNNVVSHSESLDVTIGSPISFAQLLDVMGLSLVPSENV